MGELIAEISACYLAAELGIPNSQRIDKSAAYLKSWLDCLKGDSRAIFRACSQASKSCALLLDCVRTPERLTTARWLFRKSYWPVVRPSGCGPEPHSSGMAKRESSRTGCLPERAVRNRTTMCGLWRSSWKPLKKPNPWTATVYGIGPPAEFDSERIVDSIIHRCEQGPSGRRNRDCGKRIITGVKLFIESYAYD